MMHTHQMPYFCYRWLDWAQIYDSTGLTHEQSCKLVVMGSSSVSYQAVTGDDLVQLAACIAGQFASNLRQLCGFTDGRVGRGRGGWALLEKVKYLKFSGNDSLIPVWGTASDIWKTVAGLRESMPEESFKKLLNGNMKRSKDGCWTCLNPRDDSPPPAFVHELTDGDSLLGRTVSEAAAPVRAPPDFGEMYPILDVRRRSNLSRARFVDPFSARFELRLWISRSH